MAPVIVCCHNSACKSFPEWKKRGGRRVLILLLYFIFSLSALGTEPKALEAVFIMCPCEGRDCKSPHCHVILITLCSYLACNPFLSFPSHHFHVFNLGNSHFPFFSLLSTILLLSSIFPSPLSCCSAVWLLPSSSSQQTSTVTRGTADNVNHAVCDWQLGKMAVAACRGMENPFSVCTGVGPWAHLSAENRSMDYQSQLTPSQPRVGLVGRGKAHSSTNKHEDQQMALCQS